MDPQQMSETTLRTPPFAFTDQMLSSFVEGAKVYWGCGDQQDSRRSRP